MAEGAALVVLRGGYAVPLEAVHVALAIEAAGHRLRLDGDTLHLDPADGRDVDERDLVQLRRQSRDVKLLLAKMPNDAAAPDDDPED